MASLFSKSQMSQIQQVADKCKELSNAPKQKQVNVASVSNDIEAMSSAVIKYFKDSEAILITSVDQLHEYIDKVIEFGYAGIDTETTGVDRIHDTIVGASLYVPGMPECYIPCNHIIPIFDTPYKNQLSYEEIQPEFQRMVDNKVKLAFANADFDLSMIYKDIKVDLCPSFYYDVILAWRCLKEDEKDNSLKGLYNKYVLRGKGDPKKFSDFFTPTLFPYCKPEVARLYAANDAKITYELMQWQLPFVIKDNPNCKKHKLEAISDLIWFVEFPLVTICQTMHRTGMYLDKSISNILVDKYRIRRDQLAIELVEIVDNILQTTPPVQGNSAPFLSGSDFNPKSTLHVQYLLYDLLQIPPKAKRGNKSGRSTDKEILSELNLDVTNQILKIRSLDTLIDTFVAKLPKSRSPRDGRIHASFKQIGASTGRFSCISKGTMISCPGKDKPIEEIQLDDEVYCYNDAGVLVHSKVKNRWLTGHRECVKLHWESGDGSYAGELICTPDHYIKTTNRDWVQAQDLTPDDAILYAHHRPAIDMYSKSTICGVMSSNLNVYHRVTSIEFLDDMYDVYDIEVEGYHNFIANELCVHNSESPNLQNIPSHAEDIRHMFRATPAQSVLLDCKGNEDSLIIDVSKHCTVYIESRGEVKVKDLVVGDNVRLLEDGKEVYRSVKEISVASNDASVCHVVF